MQPQFQNVRCLTKIRGSVLMAIMGKGSLYLESHWPGYHSCPVCGHPVGVNRWFWRAWIWARWNCPSCGALLRFDPRRRLLLGLFMASFLASLFGVALLCLTSNLSYWIWTVPLIVI